MSERIAHVSLRAAFAVLSAGVVGATQTAARFGVAQFGQGEGVAVTAAVARHADAVRVEEAVPALVTVRALVLWLTLVTHRLPARVDVTAGRGGDTGAGTREAGFTRSSTRSPVEVILAFLTAGSSGVALAVQTDACLIVAIGGVIVTWARLASCSPEAKVT